MTTLSTRRFATRSALDQALADRLGAALGAQGASAIMLSGGTTPMPAYRALAQTVPRHDERLHVLFSDERYVSADAPASNYFQSRTLLDALGLPPGSLLRVRTELSLADAVADYEQRLLTLLSSGVHIGLGLMGLGADGHTCSLFTPSDLARARGRYALEVHRPDGMSAVSVTPELLATVREPLFVVAGTGKRAALTRLMAGDRQLTAWAAVQGCSTVELWFDAAAES
jgi:6-phosphogluconolactonase